MALKRRSIRVKIMVLSGNFNLQPKGMCRYGGKYGCKAVYYKSCPYDRGIMCNQQSSSNFQDENNVKIDFVEKALIIL